MKALTLFYVLLFLVGCATTSEVKRSLTIEDLGNIWFETPGSLMRIETETEVIFSLGEPEVLNGKLAFPKGDGPFPSVLIAHGCGGIGYVELSWEKELRKWGYATFLIDSFRGRGLTEVCSNAKLLLGKQRTPDLYGALRILNTHPKIDMSKIVLMGFSHGGFATLMASTQWAKDTFSNGYSFKAFFPFYPYCNFKYPELKNITAPVRVHIGELDDWTPADSCEQVINELKGSGHNAEITIYQGAHHSFDNLSIRHELYLPHVDSGKNCDFNMPSVYGPLPSVAEIKECATKGATLGGNREATALARENVRDQLSKLVKE